MAIQFYMRAYNTVTQQYVDWVVNDQPDSAGTFAPGGSANLTNIVVNRTVQSKIQNFLKSVVLPSYVDNAYSNPSDGYLFHLNSYDWLNPALEGPITIPPYNQPTGISVVRGSSSVGSPFVPNQYASLFWTEEPSNAGYWTFAYIEPNGSIGMALPVNMGTLNIVGYLGVQDTITDPEAQSGLIRIPNNQFLVARNTTNTGDIVVAGTDPTNHVFLGNPTQNTTLSGTTANFQPNLPSTNKTVVGGNFTVLGSTTDTASRFVHVNWNDPALVSTIAPTDNLNPALDGYITGFTVHRGNTAGVGNSGAAMVWQEGSLLSGADGYFVFATLPEDIDTIGHNQLGIPLSVMAGSFSVSSTASPSLVTLAGEGALRVQNNTVAVASRNATSSADLMLLATDGYNNIIIGNNTATFNSTNTFIAGNLTVLGTTTTIDSTVVDIEGRVIHGNWSTASNVAPPTLLAGYSVHRGATGSIQNDGAGLMWIEGTQTVSGSDGFWLTATLPQDVDTGNQSSLVNIVKVMTGGIIVSSSPNVTPSSTIFPTVGGLRTQSATPAVTARNAAGTADNHLLSTDSGDHIVHGGEITTINKGHIFTTSTGSIYDFWFNGTSSIQLSQDNMVFSNVDGYATITQTPNPSSSVTGAPLTIAAQSAPGAFGIGGNLILTSGYGTIVDGYTAIAGSIVDLVVNGATVAAAVQNKFVFGQGRRRHVTQVFDDGYTGGGLAYYEVQATDDYIAVTGIIDGYLSVILPQNPVLGDVYEIADATPNGQAATTPIYVYGNGTYILQTAGLNTPYTINTAWGSARFTFTGNGWSVS